MFNLFNKKKYLTPLEIKVEKIIMDLNGDYIATYSDGTTGPFHYHNEKRV